MEAYLAQYIYAKSKGNSQCAGFVDNEFSEKIVALGDLIDGNGYLQEGADIEQFYEKYREALAYLERVPDYDGDECIFDAVTNRTEFPFPRLLQLF